MDRIEDELSPHWKGITMRRRLFYAGIGVLVVILFAGPVGVSHADLSFTFWDDLGVSLSFLLDTDVQDTYTDDLTYGYFEGAISDFSYRGLDADGTLNALEDTLDSTAISLWSISFIDYSGQDLNLRFLGNSLVNALSDSPTDYVFLSGDIYADAFDRRTFAVPEPATLTLFCLGVVALWGCSWQVRKNNRASRNWCQGNRRCAKSS